MEWLIGLGLLGALAVVGYLVWANVPIFGRAWGSSLTSDFHECQGTTLVLRWEPGTLNRGGNKVRLILRASSTMDAWIDSIWISRAAPAGDPSDSAADLKQFYGKARIRANTRLLLPDTGPEVKYNLFASNTLLIAVDFERGAPSGVRYTQPTGPNLTAYFLPPGAGGGTEAGRRDRSPGYQRYDSSIFLIEGIEVTGTPEID